MKGFLKLLVPAFCLFVPLAQSPGADQQPNIVFFFSDDWGRNAGVYADPEELYRIGLSTVPAYRDLDGSLTKAWMMRHQASAEGGEAMELTLGKRPAEELYEITPDPHHLVNQADQAESREVLDELREELDEVMHRTEDPRLTDAFDSLPWVAPVEAVTR